MLKIFFKYQEKTKSILLPFLQNAYFGNLAKVFVNNFNFEL
jgi:hypothetical protein